MVSHLFLGANSAIAACYFAIACLIFWGLIRGQQHLFKNPLVLATAAIFLTCALGHTAHILVMVAGEQYSSLPLMNIQVGLDLLTAMVAITYLALRRHYSLLIDGPLLLDHTRNQLAEANLQLAKINANLEHLVVERTAELVQTNQQLEKEVAERQQAETALQESHSILRAVIEGTTDSVFMKDLQGRYVVINSAGATVVGKTVEEIIGKDDTELFPHRAALKIVEDDRRLITSEINQTYEDTLPLMGELRTFFSAKTVCRNEQGKAIGIVGIARDITERKRAEQQIQELNQDLEYRVQERTAQLKSANEELEAFAYSVSHDLRAPLRSIDGFSAALLERYAEQLDVKGNHYLERVRASTQRMGQLIDDLLNLSRVTRTSLQRETVDLSVMVVAITADLQQRQPERQVEYTVAPKVVVQGDVRLLQIVLENLLSNAWKFTLNKLHPQIEFGTHRSADQQRSGGCDEQAQLQPDATTVYFVRDNGAGFSMAYAHKLFGAFQRLHAEDEFPGTGIGLATVKRIIHLHGGQVWAEGLPGQGATFYFSL